MTERYTGPFRYRHGRDRDSIDTAKHFQLADMKSFKNARETKTEWLTEHAKERTEHQPFYQRFKGKEVQ